MPKALAGFLELVKLYFLVKLGKSEAHAEALQDKLDEIKKVCSAKSRSTPARIKRVRKKYKRNK